ncbi:hypothetical protein WN51_00845 [Melipona quadrifasciata]|uniref:Uncharacterized protein n=1 Tax=Melipona quadrifasciata TaxID=166423 RepID=A0A0M9AB51_9HYME|nr:hypothetical protein WN51_00845 [Melipona quadrifasciata]
MVLMYCYGSAFHVNKLRLKRVVCVNTPEVVSGGHMERLHVRVRLRSSELTETREDKCSELTQGYPHTQLGFSAPSEWNGKEPLHNIYFLVSNSRYPFCRLCRLAVFSPPSSGAEWGGKWWGPWKTTRVCLTLRELDNVAPRSLIPLRNEEKRRYIELVVNQKREKKITQSLAFLRE